MKAKQRHAKTIHERIDALDDFTRQYLATALWSSTGDDDEPLDKRYGLDRLSHEALDRAERDCKAFYEQNQADIDHADSPSRSHAGHDLWLTRNGHGAGFWDGDYPKEIGARLTEAAHKYGELHIYPARGRLYFQ